MSMEKPTQNISPESLPEQEVAHLRHEIFTREQEEKEKEPVTPPNREEIIDKTLEEYRAFSSEGGVEDSEDAPEQGQERIVLDLSPEEHDKVMEEIVGVMMEKGIKAAFKTVEKTKNPHIADDFHRFLTEYLRHHTDNQELFRDTRQLAVFDMTLYEVLVPAEQEESRDWRQLHDNMEKLYAALLSIVGDTKKGERFSLEIAVSVNHSHVMLYVAVPTRKRELFEKQLAAIFPRARATISHDDYNIFNDDGVSLGARSQAMTHPALSIAPPDSFNQDPFRLLSSAFEKLSEEGEGMALQIVVGNPRRRYIKRYGTILDGLRKGKSFEKVSENGSILKAAGGIFKELIFGVQTQDKENEEGKENDEKLISSVTDKTSATIAECTIRIVASAPVESRAGELLDGMKAAFRQFDTPVGGGITFEDIRGRKALDFFKAYSHRTFDSNAFVPLNISELATIFHFPEIDASEGWAIKETRTVEAPLPSTAPTEGAQLGVNRYRGTEKGVFMTPEDRLRHLYVIGQTGTGKTTLLKNLIIQDIQNGEGVCMIDPHGSDIQEILAAVPPERADDIIYFDPADTARPMGLNFLEYDPAYPEQKTFVVDELLSIFKKLYGDVPESMGPAFGQYFRNAALLVLDDPETGSTLLDVARVLSDARYRAMKLSRSKNPVVFQFWKDIAEKAEGEAALENIAGYITNKFDVFIANEIMRPVIAQQKSAFNFRTVMDERKILLVNLSKGRLGDINAHLIGLSVVGKILMAALSRVDQVGKGDLPPFYLYLDEFQNVTTDSIATILSEARKYKLSLALAHQYIDQLDEKIKSAVFGNVGSMAIFRVSTQDAEYIAPQLAPVFTSQDLVNLENRKAFARLLFNGEPAKPFSLHTVAPSPVDWEQVEEYKNLSRYRYGRPREEVEAEIAKRYLK